MAEPFRIRDATEADVPAIAAIYAREVLENVATFEEVPPPESEMAARMAKVQGLGLPYIVAERDGDVLGYAYAGAFHARAAYRFTVEDTVYVRPDQHRQGIGAALLAEIIDRCEALGARQMMALITNLPDSPSIALHAVLGFRMMGVAHSVGYKFGHWLDVAYMQRPLGAADNTAPDRPAPGPLNA